MITNPTLADEFTVDRRTGLVRHAGATTAAGRHVMKFKALAERNLFVFSKGVLGLDRLNPVLHQDVCDWLQVIPAYRKLLLIPRDHLKSSIVAGSLPIHMLIQPKEHNVYRPGEDGRDTRILLATETTKLSTKQLRWIQNKLDTNEILRSLWPHCVWSNSRRDSPKWTEEVAVIPRPTNFREGSIEAVGVGTAITGHHYTAHIFDDLVTFEASRSELAMSEAIAWFTSTRALMDDVETGLEFTIGTKWAVYDLYTEIMKDKSVAHRVMAMIENGEFIFPRPPGKNYGFNAQIMAQLQNEFKARFWLLYMNSAEIPELCPLNMDDARYFTIHQGNVAFADDNRDLQLDDSLPMPKIPESVIIGQKVDRSNYDATLGRIEYLRRGRAT